MTGVGTAVVIGATGAVGGAIRQRLRKSGLAVVMVARDEAALGALAGSDPALVACATDIGSNTAGDAIATACAQIGGSVRMVVQAAGLPPTGPLSTIDPEALGIVVSLKLGGLIKAVRAVEDQLSAGSRIVAIGGQLGSEPDWNACGAGVANAALANLVRQLADLYGPRGITAHLISPGPLDTDRMRRIASSVADKRGTDVETVLGEYRAKSPAARLTTPSEVAWAVELLLAPEADALLGSTIVLDSGARRGVF